jgi:DNA modification methylase
MKKNAAAPPAPPIGEMVRLETLKLDDTNTNRHDQRGIDAIKYSLREFGQQKPIVIDRKGTVRAGNGTYQAARGLGWEWIWCVKTKLDGAKLRAYAHGDNRSARFSKDEDAAVAALLLDLQKEDERLILAAGYTDSEADKVLRAAEKSREAAGAVDDVPEPPRKPTCQPDDTWDLGPHRIHCGDATASATYVKLFGVATHAKPAACVFTDPPYGVDYDNQKCGPDRPERLAVAGDKAAGKDLVELVAGALKHAVANSRDTAAFYIWHASSTREDFTRAMKMAGLEERQYLIWSKTNHVLSRNHYQWSHEPCFYAAKAGQVPAWYGAQGSEMTVWAVAIQGREASAYTVAGGVVVVSDEGELFVSDRRPKGKKGLRVVRLEEGQRVLLDTNGAAGTLWTVQKDHAPEHPTAKPVELARRALINSTKRGDVVLDPFMGGGSTLLACDLLGRAFRGAELEPAYVDVAVKRWQRLTGKRATCANRPEATIA